MAAPACRPASTPRALRPPRPAFEPRGLARLDHNVDAFSAVLREPGIIEPEASEEERMRDSERLAFASGDPDKHPLADEILTEPLGLRVRDDAAVLQLRIDQDNGAPAGVASAPESSRLPIMTGSPFLMKRA